MIDSLLLNLQVLTLILLPLYVVRFHLFAIPATMLEVLIGLCLCLFAWQLLMNYQHKKLLLKSSFDIPLLLFLVSAAISVFTAPDLFRALGIFKAYFVEPILFFYSLLYTTSKFGDKKLFWGLVISATWLSVLALVQKLTHSYTLVPVEIAQDRVTAVFNSANSLALFLGPIILLLLGQLFESRNLKAKLLAGALSGFFLIITVWTKSRGGLVGELVAGLVFAYIAFSSKFILWRKLWWFLVTFIVLSTVAFLLYSYQTFNPLVQSHDRFFHKPDTMQIRLAVWTGTVNLLKDRPIFGAGLDGFSIIYNSQYKLTHYQEDVQYPHNIVLTFWSEQGLLGLFAFVGLAVVFYHRIFCKIWQVKRVFWGAGLLGAMSFLLIHGVVDVPYFKNDLSLEFWTLLAFGEYYLRV